VKKSFSRQQPKTELSELLNMEANGTGVAIFLTYRFLYGSRCQFENFECQVLASSFATPDFFWGKAIQISKSTVHHGDFDLLKAIHLCLQ
jgi:hypothetical protein